MKRRYIVYVKIAERDFNSSHHKKKKGNDVNWCILKFTVLIILQYIHTTNHYVVYPKRIQFYMSIMFQ